MSHEEEAPVKEHRKPASLSKEIISNPVGKYTLQLASYPNETEAQKMTDELKEKGFSAFYISAQVKDKSWYRVSVGLFATQKEALSHKADLMEKTKVNSAIIQKITQPF
jgi:septal ring-binding cell division protein DamX